MLKKVITVRQEKEKEYVVCNNCGSNQPVKCFIIQGFQIVDCAQCGLRYVNPRLTADAINVLYTIDYFKSDDSVVYGYDDYIAEHDTIIKTFQKRWNGLSGYLPTTGSMLDIGAACGFLMEVAKFNGWQSRGLEVSADMAKVGRDKYGHDILVGALTNPKLQPSSYDLITMWDTIEHSPDPIGDLKRIEILLKPGGVLSLITPDSGSLHAKIFGSKWVEYQRPQEHIYFFSHQLLETILKQNGFEIVWSGTAGKYVSWKFALNRLRCYWPGLIKVAEWIMKRAGIYETFTYIDPKDKMSIVARKKKE
ncbi:MAG: class I SAM-dependent methyltransferase [bacterium]|nr:class I SAM-dependent methyltransferase [bacterium]